MGFGKNCCAGLLSGSLVSSVQLAISMSNTGGAWDNPKKYISAGGLGKEFCKGSEAHKNSVTGDTVGDPLKDTSGPALNIVMKLTAIISLVFGSAIADFSNSARHQAVHRALHIMRALLQLSLLATSSAFVIPTVKFAVPARAKLVLSEVDECIVDAENAAELAACKDEAPVAPPAASGNVVDECIVDAENAAEIADCKSTTLGTTFDECLTDAENAAEIADCGSPPVETVVDVDLDCLVNAENAEEQMACGDTTLSTTYEECLTDAENAAEIAECGVAPAAPPANVAVTATVDREECIVNAESAAEIADCN